MLACVDQAARGLDAGRTAVRPGDRRRGRAHRSQPGAARRGPPDAVAAAVRRDAGAGASDPVVRGAGTAGGLGRGGGAAHRPGSAAGRDARGGLRSRSPISSAQRRAPRGRLPAQSVQARVRGGGAGRAGGVARSRSPAVAAHDGERPQPRTDREHLQGQPVDRDAAGSRARARRCWRRPSAASAASWACERDEFMSLAGLLVSRIDLSISRVLETSSPEYAVTPGRRCARRDRRAAGSRS